MKNPLHLVLGVSGGIAAYKIPELIRILRKYNVEVKVVLTEAALPFVGEEALRTVSGNRVYADHCRSEHDMDHIRLAEWADLLLICPATANTIAKIAHGLADNLLSTLVVSFEGKILLAPSMNSAMWKNRATQDNVEICAKRGLRILPVSDGPLACGSEGPGRMLSLDSIAEYVLSYDLPLCFTGKKILIASGPTQEPVDPVRILTNLSSGKMGAALARAGLSMGASVTVVTGPAATALPEEAKTIRVKTANEMAEAVFNNFDGSDVCIMAAAVSDFSPESILEKKLTRDGADSMKLNLIQNPDIAAALGKKKKSQFLVTFALETDPGSDRARKKMREKKCDMTILNFVPTSLGKETSEATVLFPDQEPQQLPIMQKRILAQTVLLRIAEKMGLTNG